MSEAPLTAIKMGKAFKAAEAAGAERVVVVGPDEWADRSVKVKQLATGEQELVPLEKLA